MKFNSQQIFLLLQHTDISKTQMWINFAVSIWCLVLSDYAFLAWINLVTWFLILSFTKIALSLSLSIYSSFFLSGSDWRWTGRGPWHADRDLQQNPDAGVPGGGWSCDAGHEGRADRGGEETGMYLYSTHSVLSVLPKMQIGCSAKN